MAQCTQITKYILPSIKYFMRVALERERQTATKKHCFSDIPSGVPTIKERRINTSNNRPAAYSEKRNTYRVTQALIITEYVTYPFSNGKNFAAKLWG